MFARGGWRLVRWKMIKQTDRTAKSESNETIQMTKWNCECVKRKNAPEQQHECRIDHTVVQIHGRAIKIEQSVHLILKGGHRFEQIVSAHRSQVPILTTSFHFGKIDGHRTIGKGLFINVVSITTNVGGHVITFDIGLVQKVGQLKWTVGRGQVLGKTFISIAHQVVYGDKRFEHHNPGAVWSSFDEQIGQLWNGYVGFVCTLQQIVEMLLFGSQQFFRRRLAYHTCQSLTGKCITCRIQTVV